MAESTTTILAPTGALADGATLPAATTGRLWTWRRIAVLAAAYGLALGAMVLVKGVFLSPDRYFLILLVPALALGVGRRYVRDFLPFIALIFLYENLRALDYWINDSLLGRAPFVQPMVGFDRIVGLGQVPSVRLQAWLWTGSVQWYDEMVAVWLRMHFIVPPTLLFLIWLSRRDQFYRAAATIVIASMIGAFCFLLFPAAPPWWAAQHGFLGAITKIGDVQASGSPVGTSRSLLWGLVGPNPVAAVPSLHTAYSLLTLIFAWRWNRIAGILFLPYPLAMWFGIVYFGDHYVFDIVCGVAVALFALWLSGRLLRPGAPLARLAGPFAPPLAAARSFVPGDAR